MFNWLGWPNWDEMPFYKKAIIMNIIIDQLRCKPKYNLEDNEDDELEDDEDDEVNLESQDVDSNTQESSNNSIDFMVDLLPIIIVVVFYIIYLIISRL